MYSLINQHHKFINSQHKTGSINLLESQPQHRRTTTYTAQALSNILDQIRENNKQRLNELPDDNLLNQSTNTEIKLSQMTLDDLNKKREARLEKLERKLSKPSIPTVDLSLLHIKEELEKPLETIKEEVLEESIPVIKIRKPRVTIKKSGITASISDSKASELKSPRKSKSSSSSSSKTKLSN